MNRRKQRKPTSRELVRTLIDKCGLPPSKRTVNVLSRQQLAELVIHVDNQEMRIHRAEQHAELDTDASPATTK